MMDFDTAVEKLIGPTEEGGYANNRADPGGPTMYGVTQALAAKHGWTGPMRLIPISLVKVIYKGDFWIPCRCDLVPECVRYAYFTLAVNAGAYHAAQALQLAAGVLVHDGVVGPNTLAAANAAAAKDASRLAARFTAARLLYYTSCFDWPAFGRSWTTRECNNVLNN